MAEAELKQAKRMKEGVDELSESNERKRKIYEKNIADHQEYQVTTQKKINIMEKDKKDLVKELDMEKSELERNREAKERMDRETERYNKASRWITYQLTYGKQCEECSEKTNGLLPDAVYEVKDQSTSDQPK
uniref:DUF3967 domain-containing protein n=1 Tax=Caenorhabditis tropicalis TaxID=1561998 RepID=A0A1I7US24_9PELO